MKRFGIDISTWQGMFDFAAAKSEGVEFAIVKGAGGDDGLYKDSQFERNYEEAQKHGIDIGCYFYSYAKTIARAQEEADFFYENCLKGRKFQLPVFIDIESQSQFNLGKTALTDLMLAFVKRLREHGYFCGVYSSLYMLKTYFETERFRDIPSWVACWSDSCEYAGSDNFAVWQFGGETNYIRSNKIAGVVCDQDYQLIDYTDLFKLNGLNGYSVEIGEPEQTEMPALKTNLEIAAEVWAGKWGVDDDRKQRLERAGYSYEKIQEVVNMLADIVEKTK